MVTGSSTSRGETAWDYIIVGAGSAGCVLAARLSERPDLKILLLDAGSARRSILVAVPGGVNFVIGDPRFDWCYRSEPDASRKGAPIQWAGGRVVGGGSAINGMVFNRGLARDYDTWEALGCLGWGGRDVAPYFRSLETFRGPATPSRGTDGPLTVEHNRFRFTLVPKFLEACAEVGLPTVPDINDFPIEGVGVTQASTRRGIRQSTRVAFLDPALRRGNLTLRTECFATRLIVENGACVGVAYQQHGQSHEVRAREVIVCAGALASPKLLLLSGIGPAAASQAAGIPVVRDLPGVGRNLQDHGGAVIATASSVRTISAMEMKPWRMLLNGIRWAAAGTGPAAGAAVLATGMVRSSDAEPAPDILLQFTALSLAKAGGQQFSKDGGYATICSVARPETRGHLELASPDPLAPARVHHQQLGHPEDMRRLIAGIRRVCQIHAAPALAPYSLGERLPGREIVSDAALEDYCRSRVGTQYHLSGTCRMGDGPDAVVAPDLRVIGLRGLRVADASVIPRVTSANLNAPVMMIAEKAAAMIKAELDAPH